MKKILVGLAALIVVLVAAVLIVPGMIDWNDYKKEIAAQAKAATGRDLKIGGDIKIAILPAPALRANDVSLSNAAGASTPTMARLKLIEVRVAFGPLLTGKIEVETIKLVEPVIEFEVLADGRKNWEFGTKPGDAASPKPGTPATPATPAKTAPSIRLDNFTIENGTLAYRDAKAGIVERIEAMNAKIAAASLSGPFEATGSLKARGVPLRFDVAIGKVIEERTMPLNVTLSTGGAKAQVAGTVGNLIEVPRFKGKLKVEGASLADLIRAVQPGEPMPGFLGQAFSVEGNAQGSAEGGEIRDLEIALGDSKASAAIAVKLDKTVNVQAQLAVNRVDLDKWLALPPASTPSPSPAETKGKSTSVPPPKPAAAAKGKPPAVQIPTDIAGSLVMSVGAITYRGSVISQTRLKAELADGEITLSQFSSQLPGGSDVAVFGFMSAAKGTPRFEGEVELSLADTRAVLKWLAIEPPLLPADRLRQVKVASKMVATPEQIQLAGIDTQFDGSRLTGGISVALRERLSFGADLALDKINLDAYLSPAPTKKPAAARSDAPADKTRTAPAQAAAPASDPFAGLKALSAFDANLKAQVKTLTYKGETIRDVVFDGTLFNGALDIRRAAVGQVAGATLNLSGGVRGLGGAPQAKDLRFEARVGDLAKLMALAAVEVPAQVKGLGAVAATGRLDGGLLAPTVNLNVKATGAEVAIDGKATVLPAPAIDGTLKASAGDLAKFLSTLGIDYRPTGRIGAVSLAGALRASPTVVELSGLKASAGTLSAEGNVQAHLAGAKPRIVADLRTGELQIDSFLPAKRTASLDPIRPARDGLLIPAAWSGAPVLRDFGRPFAEPAQARRSPQPPPTRRGQWPTDPIDLSALRSLDADVKLKSTAIAFDKYRLENADVVAQLAGGVLRAERLSGVLFGGALQANAVVSAAAVPKVDATLALKDADVGKAVQAFADAAAATGRMSMDLKLATAGDNAAAMVSSLNGGGAVALNRLDVSGGGQGSALAGALGLITSLNQLGGTLTGQKTRGTQADITGTFVLEKGVARSNDLKLVSGLGNGQAQGAVDLPRWAIDVSGQIQLAPNLLTQLVDKRAQGPQPVPFQVRGTLDAPDVKLDVSKLPAGLPIPGADRLLKKKGVGDVLQGIIGGSPGQQPESAPSTPQAQPQQPPQPQPQQPDQRRRVRPEDLLKGIFR